MRSAYRITGAATKKERRSVGGMDSGQFIALSSTTSFDKFANCRSLAIERTVAGTFPAPDADKTDLADSSPILELRAARRWLRLGCTSTQELRTFHQTRNWHRLQGAGAGIGKTQHSCNSARRELAISRR